VASLKQERAYQQEVIGKQALFVTNLEPRRICGLISQGKLFHLGYEDGVCPVLATPKTPVPDDRQAG
jgi:tRNA-binding protein